ncbi:MAG TPA: LysM peptidoglycan-binding domain-containing protein, partial [Arthrobacter sp.]|nr:LysM peptidoglycan-binding domain-containing protein [Arthrobacter sp.]
MTTSRSPKPTTRSSLPMIAATTAALPAVVLSSLAMAQPAAAESRTRAIPATLAAAMQAQAQGQTARSLGSALIPANSVPAAVPSAFRPAQVSVPEEYTIARGDTISGIAGKFGLDTYAILELNGLQANTLIYPGQKIKLGGSSTAPEPAAPATPAAAAAGSVYTVKSGDTLGAIAARHGVKLSEVFGWNGLNLGSIIYPGQQIKIGGGTEAPAPSAPAAPAPAAPAPVAPAATAPASGSYTIKSGDTLSGIAARNGVKLADILSANRLTMSSIIYPGQKLALPGASLAPAATPPAATVTPLVPSTFLGYTYPAAVVSSANQNKALLNASPVPSREQMKTIIADTARRMGVDPSLALAFAFQESSFD